MPTPNSSTLLAPTSSTGPSFGSRIGACLLHPLAFFRRANPDPQRVALLTDAVIAEPALRHWLLIVASEPARVRRALIARATVTLRMDAGLSAAADALEQLANEPLLHAVTTTLLQSHGISPLTPAHRTGRRARLRLGELAARFETSRPPILTP